MAKGHSHPSNVFLEEIDDAVGEVGKNVTAFKVVIYGFLFENNSSDTDVFIQIFNDELSAVTVGTTLAHATYLVRAGESFGRDPQDRGLHHLPEGFSYAVTGGRADAVAPAADASCKFWYAQREG